LKLPIIGILSGVALATLGISSAAQAAILLPSLTPGSQYRLVFVTSGTKNATSTSIADYNQFVNNAAQASTNLNTALTTAGFTPSTINWKAIASTAAVNARVNTSTQATDTSVPIYRLNGDQVATGNADLWDSSISNPIQYNELGSLVGALQVWTGTLANGVTSGNGAANALGKPNVSYGFTNLQNEFWTFRADEGQKKLYNLYGISSVLTVPTPTTATTPEPSSLLSFITLGGLILGGAVRGVRK
jgi:hypothetical protein